MAEASIDNCLSDEVIDRYHAGDLEDAERAGVDVHLAGCDSCRLRESARRAAAEQIMRSLQEIDRPLTGESTEGLTAECAEERGGDAHRIFTESDAIAAVGGRGLAPGASLRSASKGPDPVFPRIEGYEIIRILGRGGMGIVYEAVQQKLGRHVALKVLPAVVSSAHRDLVERFRREATAASKLHHTNIIPIYDYGESRDGYFYAMELLEGQPLSTIIRRIAAQSSPITSPTDIAAVVGVGDGTDDPIRTPHGSGGPGEWGERPRTPVRGSETPTTSGGSSTDRGRVYYRQVASWTADAADALHYAHLQGLIHRDVKPGNIMVCRDGRIVLVDFGLVKETGSDSVTATGSLLGTYRYMSPEQIGAKRIRVDARTDVYSLGATLYELLTLQPAYAAADQSELLGQILWKEPTPPRKVVPSVPVDLQTICQKAMEKAPSARYATGRDMADDLRQFIGNLPIRARPVGAMGRVAKLARRHPGVSLMSGIVLVLVAVFASIGLYQQGQRRRERETAAREKVIAINGEGLRHHENRNWKAAAASFEEALALDPHSVKTLINLGRLEKDLFYLESDRRHLDRMLTLADRALEVEASNERALNVRMVALREQGQLDVALRTAETIHKITPNYFAAAVNVGGIHALRGDIRMAERWLRDGVRLAPFDPPPGSMPWRNLAALEHFLGEASAWETMQAGLEAASDKLSPGDLAFVALLRLEIEAYRDVDDGLRKAITADTMSSRGERTEAIPRILALAYLRNQQYDKALDAARTSLELNQRIESHTRLLMALAHAHRGDLNVAKSELDRSNHAWAAESKPGGYVCRIENGLLWFVSQKEMDELRVEAESAIGGSGDRPTSGDRP